MPLKEECGLVCNVILRSLHLDVGQQCGELFVPEMAVAEVLLLSFKQNY